MNKSIVEYFANIGTEVPDVVDLRGLEAPEPMQRILLATTNMPIGEKYLAHLPHVPYPLFPNLEIRNLQWKVFEQTDDSALVLIWRTT